MKNNQMDRRDFIKTGTGLGLATLTAANISASKTAKTKQRPNVVFIICDQMRGDALSCLGNPNARTPNLDSLAEDGVLCRSHFSNNPVCVPSRMSLFSGLYPHQTGRLSNKSWDAPLLEFDNTLAAAFKRNGYRIGWVGKNHTYKKKAFSEFDYASIRAREPFRQYSRFIPPHWHSDTYWPEELCHPRKNTDEAVGFIENSKRDEPFFLHVSYFDPHPPYMAPAEYTSQFDSSKIKLLPYTPPSQLSERLEQYAHAMRLDKIQEADLIETFRYYYASVMWGVDYQVGRIMKTLAEKDLLDNTLILFTSDHGDFMGDYHMVRKGMFLYNSLLNVPMIWRMPSQMAKGLRVDSLTQGVDIFPTLLDLCGIESEVELSGRSLKPLLSGEKDEVNQALFTTAAYGDVSDDIVNPSIHLEDEDDTPLHTRVMSQGMLPNHDIQMIRTKEWKLILNESDPPELYHLNGGFIEERNVIDEKQYTNTRKQLEKELLTWRPM